MAGFDGAGTVAGVTWGVRDWGFPLAAARYGPPSMKMYFTQQETDGIPRTYLCGRAGYAWDPGVNTAVCRYYGALHQPPQEHDPVTGRECGCGFWAYWDTQPDAGCSFFSFRRDWLPVRGIIEGTGRTLIGTQGFRCEKARILALCRGGRGWSSPERWEASAPGLARTYPGAVLFGDAAKMLAAYPPGERPGEGALPWRIKAAGCRAI